MTNAEKLDALVALFDGGDLNEFAINTNIADELIIQISAETGVSRLIIRLLFKLLGAVIFAKTTNIALSVGNKFVMAGFNTILRIPGVSNVLDALLSRFTRATHDAKAREALTAYLSGNSSAVDDGIANSLSHDLQLDLRAINKIDTLDQTLKNDINILIGSLNKQPPLTTKILRINHVTRFIFSSRWITFTGRTDELSLLTNFAQHEAIFSWWIITGPGGAGKSRLALEFALGIGVQWRSGFLEESSSFDEWTTWQPERPTLLVIDYAANGIWSLKRLLITLLRRQEQNPLCYPVRVLLIERTIFGDWWNQLLIGSEGHAIRQAAYQELPLKLLPVSDDDLWNILSFVASQGEAIAPVRRIVLPILKQLDRDARPLFAALAGEALRLGRDIHKWNKIDILRDLLVRERELIWKGLNFDIKYQNLLALASLVGGLNLNNMQDILKSEHIVDLNIPNLSEFDFKTYWSAVDGQGEFHSVDVIPPLVPDILGEFFFLDHITSPEGKLLVRSEIEYRALQYKEAAWASAPAALAGSASVFARLCGDFANHPVVRLLLVPPNQDEKILAAWANAVVEVIPALTAERRFAMIKEIITNAESSFSRDGIGGEYGKEYARVLFNGIVTFTDALTYRYAFSLLDNMSIVFTRFPDDSDILVRYIKSIACFVRPNIHRADLARIEIHIRRIGEASESIRPDELMVEAYSILVINYIQSVHTRRHFTRFLFLLHSLFNLVTRSARGAVEVSYYIAAVYMAMDKLSTANMLGRLGALAIYHRNIVANFDWPEYTYAFLARFGIRAELIDALREDIKLEVLFDQRPSIPLNLNEISSEPLKWEEFCRN